VTGEAGLRLEGLRVALEGRTLVALDTAIAPGEVLTVMGPSGSGKSTLLAAIIGALDSAFALSGRVLLDGCDITGLPPERRGIGILFQDDVLFPHLSVGANLAFGLAPRLRPRSARRARIEEALAEAGLAGFADRDPATLSGGQRARVALLRTILAEPRALMLDEPFAKLDAELRDRIRRYVFDTARRHGLPVLLATHDGADARAAGGPVLSPLGRPLQRAIASGGSGFRNK
jgi:putative thiamine transport system ATP-binding protein